MTERAIVNQIRDWLRARDYWVIKLHGSAFQMAGIPDLLAIRAGRAIWLEVKRPGEAPTRLQLHVLDQLRSVGCVAAVVRCIEDAAEALGEIRP